MPAVLFSLLAVLSTAAGGLFRLPVLDRVSLMHLHKNPRPRTVALLAVDALAPRAGAASTLALHLPGPAVALYLGFFAGFLLYIGAADILPQAHSERPSMLAIVLTCFGAG